MSLGFKRLKKLPKSAGTKFFRNMLKLAQDSRRQKGDKNDVLY